MKYQELLDLGNASNEPAYRKMLVSLAGEMEFDRVTASVLMFDGSGKRVYLKKVDNMPADFWPARKSPLLKLNCTATKLIRQRALPFASCQKMYLDDGAIDFWHHLAKFQCNCGINVPFPTVNCVEFGFSVDREKDLPTDQEALARLMADAYLLGTYAKSAAERLFKAPALKMDDIPELTPREIEVLRWSMAGKSAWETGRILNVSEHTVNFHIKNSVRKLAATNKREAVVKGMSLGIL